MGDQMGETSHTTIYDIPDEILEYILSKTSQYGDYKSAMLVCRRWHKLILGVIEQEYKNFHRAVDEGTLTWSTRPPDLGPSITSRYSHSACYFDKSVYVFGGCTFTNTTFNDLWRFDLATGDWIRPLATGMYPSPKACASLVAYKESLVLFGGWSHPFAHSLHQASKFFNQLHVYSPSSNRWTQVVTASTPPGVAGHAASVLANHMVVFGGSRGHGISCNDVWMLDLVEMNWTSKDPLGPKPRPRYGHSQVVLDDDHILVLGGCGGPNMQYSDVWVLNMESELWAWEEVSIAHPHNCPPQLWCHPACKVGDKVVVMGKMQTSPSTADVSTLQPQIRHQCERPPEGAVHAAPGPGGLHLDSAKLNIKRSHPDTTSESSSQDSSSDNDENSLVNRSRTSGRGYHHSRCVLNGRTVSAKARNSSSANLPRTPHADQPTDQAPGSKGCMAADQTLGGGGGAAAAGASGGGGAGAAGGGGAASPHSHTAGPRTGLPSVRPNAMKNRQKQLETLKRYEDKIKTQNNKQVDKNVSYPCYLPQGGVPPFNAGHSPGGSSTSGGFYDGMPLMGLAAQNPMYVYTLDISGVLASHQVTWMPVSEYAIRGAPEETILCSVLEGRGELIMFGGVQTDLFGMQRGLNVQTQAVCSRMHFLSHSRLLR